MEIAADEVASAIGTRPGVSDDMRRMSLAARPREPDAVRVAALGPPPPARARHLIAVLGLFVAGNLVMVAVGLVAIAFAGVLAVLAGRRS
jgi:hypothetical protein